MHYYKTYKGGPLFFGGGAPIIMGGMSSAEMNAQLERASLENDRMLARAADEQIRLQSELDKRDQEMESLMEQQARQQEMDLGDAQKALAVELDSQDEDSSADDLKTDFSALEAALAEGLGYAEDTPRPV